MSDTEFCKNCEAELNLTDHYCPNCGQKTADDLTMGVLFNRTIGDFFSVDARFFRSFIPLMLKPGVLARRYVDGKRLKYLHPAQFYLFISVIFFFLFSMATRQQQMDFNNMLKKGFETEINDSISIRDLNISNEEAEEIKKVIANNKVVFGAPDLKQAQDQMQVVDSILTDTTEFKIFNLAANKAKLDSLIEINASHEEKLAIFGVNEKSDAFTRLMARQGLKFYERQGGGVLESFYDTIPISMFFLLPLFAMILKILYFRTGTFAHHMVFSFYYFTFMFMVLSFLAIINLIWEIPDWIDFLVVFSTLFYLLLSLWRFYQQHFIWTLIKGGILSFIYMTFVLPLSLVVMFLISFLIY